VRASPPQGILAHVQSSFRKFPTFVPFGTYPCFVVEKLFVVLSDNVCFASVTAPLSIVHTVPLEETVMSHLSPSETHPPDIVSILSYRAFFVGTSVDPFHPAP
jgi:hypothetical protein